MLCIPAAFCWSYHHINRLSLPDIGQLSSNHCASNNFLGLDASYAANNISLQHINLSVRNRTHPSEKSCSIYTCPYDSNNYYTLNPNCFIRYTKAFDIYPYS